MKRDIVNLSVLVLLSFIITPFLLTGQTLASDTEMVGVQIMKKGLVGKYLADGEGITLYNFTKDEKNTSNCMEGCAVNWPPFYVDPAAVIEGCESSDFNTITRTDGKQQTTYKGMPLYYFKNDKYPGDTFGHGLGEVWFLVTP